MVPSRHAVNSMTHCQNMYWHPDKRLECPYLTQHNAKKREVTRSWGPFNSEARSIPSFQVFSFSSWRMIKLILQEPGTVANIDNQCNHSPAKKCDCGHCYGVHCAFSGPSRNIFSSSKVIKQLSGVAIRQKLATRVCSAKESTVHSWEVQGVMAIIPNSPHCTW
jgi:hypothetical protein